MTGRLLGGALPAVDLSHGDLPRRDQRPEQHRRDWRSETIWTLPKSARGIKVRLGMVPGGANIRERPDRARMRVSRLNEPVQSFVFPAAALAGLARTGGARARPRWVGLLCTRTRELSPRAWPWLAALGHVRSLSGARGAQPAEGSRGRCRRPKRQSDDRRTPRADGGGPRRSREKPPCAGQCRSTHDRE